jgi:peptide methionine sulfoxide reductase MsrB
MSEKEYPVKIDETELAQKLDPLSYDVLRNAATERPFTGEYTAMNCLEVKQSFIQAADGHLFTLQQLMMRLS